MGTEPALANALEMVSEDFLVELVTMVTHQDVIYVSVHKRSLKCVSLFKINKHYLDYYLFIALTISLV